MGGEKSRRRETVARPLRLPRQAMVVAGMRVMALEERVHWFKVLREPGVCCDGLSTGERGDFMGIALRQVELLLTKDAN